MTEGVGGATADQELERLSSLREPLPVLDPGEYENRIERAVKCLENLDCDAVYLNAGNNLQYFTGTTWHPSERLVGAILCRDGTLVYLAPYFERGTLQDFMVQPGEVFCWHEHECPYRLTVDVLRKLGVASGRVAIDETCPYFLADGLIKQTNNIEWCAATGITSACRQQKSANEIALLQFAKNLTIEVHRSAAKILKPGISTTEVNAFINSAHQYLGTSGNSFCIVLFGTATAFPHGVRESQHLKPGDMVLIDTGCRVSGYHSDITRSYVFGPPTSRQREIWDLEKRAQSAAFDAAQVDVPCEAVDLAARSVITEGGLGPDYQLPGLPHRSGHGIGMDVHEHPYIVKGNGVPLKPGMCFSNEPMICVPGEFGVRLEDHIYMTDEGPRWFTQPSEDIENPLNY